MLHFGSELFLIFDTYDTHTNQPFLDQVHVYKLMKVFGSLYQKIYQNNVVAQNDGNFRFSKLAKLCSITLYALFT